MGGACQIPVLVSSGAVTGRAYRMLGPGRGPGPLYSELVEPGGGGGGGGAVGELRHAEAHAAEAPETTRAAMAATTLPLRIPPGMLGDFNRTSVGRSPCRARRSARDRHAESLRPRGRGSVE